MTLRQSLKKFRSQNQEIFDKGNSSKEADSFLLSHDVAHVIFNCDTSIYGEGKVKIWTTFGTTLGFWEVVKGYNDASAFQLFKMYSLGHVAKNIGRIFFVIPSIIFRAKRMSKPWPFNSYQSYMDMPLKEIRSNFNIQILI